VPRLWYPLRARVPAAGNKPNWFEGFFAEVIIWGAGVSVVVLAITLNTRVFEKVLWTAVGLQTIVGLWIRLKARAAAAAVQK
jgi:hypothetical protein